ncbi:MAG: DNA/RNA non-specific endonuclease [Microscillaceae bacterium]|nr:DNA/RNA non-specific endonuclease [Microscillaceae bacterium]
MENSKKQKLRALLVGIDEYHPNSSVKSLRGCKNDIHAFAEILKQKYSFLEPDILLLKDQEATQEGIVRAFRAHLRDQADENTTTLFYFSGHGSQQATPEIFQKYLADENYKLEETLVCYDSRAKDPKTGKFIAKDLADKELAILIEELEQKKAHVVFILDCCHSGSATREIFDEEEIDVRDCDARDLQSALNRSYLDNYYEKMLQEKGEVIIPRKKHILLGACQKDQTAKEIFKNDRRGGAFSFHLLKVLEENDLLSYNDLFSLVHHSIQKESFQKAGFPQNPQFETFNFFDASTLFLVGSKSPTSNKRYRLSFENNAWMVELGSISGLASDAQQHCEFAIYENHDSEEVLSYAKGLSIGMDKSSLEIAQTSQILDTQKNYWAELISLPFTKEQVHIQGYIQTLEELKALPSPYIEFSTERPDSDYQVWIDKDYYQIFYRGDEKYQQFKGAPFSAEEILHKLEQIARWNILLYANNPRTELDASAFPLIFETRENLERKIQKEGQPNSDRFAAYEVLCEKNKFYKQQGFEWLVPYLIKAKNNSDRDVYFTLLYFSPDYGIEVYANEHVPKKSKEIVLSDQYGLNPRDRIYTQDNFKLLISTKELKNFYFTQPGLRSEATRDSVKLPDETRTPEDWISKDISVKVIKAGKRLEMIYDTPGYQEDFMGEGLKVAFPVLDDKWQAEIAPVEGNKDNILHYLNYSLMQNALRRFPFYTATNILGNEFKKIARKQLFGGSDQWEKDPRISEDHQWGKELYNAPKSDFDRGHMTKREDVQWGKEPEKAKLAAMSTFYYTNAVPQRKEVNQDIWRDLEDYILQDETVKKHLKINVFTGPVLKKDDPIFVSEVKGTHPQIPTLFWKIVYFTKNDGKLYRVAFLVGQRHLLEKEEIVIILKDTEPNPLEDLFSKFEKAETYQVNIKTIEDLTGLRFTEALEPYQDKRPTALTLEEIEVRDTEYEKTVSYVNGLIL